MSVCTWVSFVLLLLTSKDEVVDSWVENSVDTLMREPASTDVLVPKLAIIDSPLLILRVLVLETDKVNRLSHL